MSIAWLPPVEPEDLYPVYQYTVDLAEVEYTYRLTYRERQDGWYLDLYDSDGEPLLLGRRLALGALPLKRRVVAGMPDGLFLLIDRSGSDTDPTYEDLGYRVRLAWIPSDDLSAVDSGYDVTTTVT